MTRAQEIVEAAEKGRIDGSNDRGKSCFERDCLNGNYDPPKGSSDEVKQVYSVAYDKGLYGK